MAPHVDLFEEQPDGTEVDAWIFDELLGDDAMPDPYAHVIPDADDAAERGKDLKAQRHAALFALRIGARGDRRKKPQPDDPTADPDPTDPTAPADANEAAADTALATNPDVKAAVDEALGETDATASDWIEQYIEDRVDQIGEDTEEAMQELMDQAMAGTLTPKVTAILVEQSMGITSRQSASLQDKLEELQDAEDDAWVGDLHVPDGGLSWQSIAGAVIGLGAAYLADRIDTNSTHDPLEAANQGQRDTWTDAADAGLFNPDTATRYIIGVEPCPVCQDIIDQGAIAFDEEYDVPDGYDTLPPFHPNCDCVEALDYTDEDTGDDEEVDDTEGDGEDA